MGVKLECQLLTVLGLESACSAGDMEDTGFDPWVRNIPGGGKWQFTSGVLRMPPRTFKSCSMGEGRPQPTIRNSVCEDCKMEAV